MTRSIAVLAACLLLSGLAVAGCGGGDSTTGGDGEVASNAGADGQESESPSGIDGPSGSGKPDGGGNSEEGGGGSSDRAEPFGDGGSQPPSSAGGSGNGGGSQSSDGASDGGGDAEAPISKAKARFVAKANKLCDQRRQEMQTKVRKILEGAQKSGSQQAALQRIVSMAIIPGMEREADELRGLKAPPGDKKEIESITTSIDSTIEGFRENLNIVLESENVFEDSQKAARAYGIAKCGRTT